MRWKVLMARVPKLLVERGFGDGGTRHCLPVGAPAVTVGENRVADCRIAGLKQHPHPPCGISAAIPANPCNKLSVVQCPLYVLIVRVLKQLLLAPPHTTGTLAPSSSWSPAGMDSSAFIHDLNSSLDELALAHDHDHGHDQHPTEQPPAAAPTTGATGPDTATPPQAQAASAAGASTPAKAGKPRSPGGSPASTADLEAKLRAMSHDELTAAAAAAGPNSVATRIYAERYESRKTQPLEAQPVTATKVVIAEKEGQPVAGGGGGGTTATEVYDQDGGGLTAAGEATSAAAAHPAAAAATEVHDQDGGALTAAGAAVGCASDAAAADAAGGGGGESALEAVLKATAPPGGEEGAAAEARAEAEAEGALAAGEQLAEALEAAAPGSTGLKDNVQSDIAVLEVRGAGRKDCCMC